MQERKLVSLTGNIKQEQVNKNLGFECLLKTTLCLCVANIYVLQFALNFLHVAINMRLLKKALRWISIVA